LARFTSAKWNKPVGRKPGRPRTRNLSPTKPSATFGRPIDQPASLEQLAFAEGMAKRAGFESLDAFAIENSLPAPRSRQDLAKLIARARQALELQAEQEPEGQKTDTEGQPSA